MIGGEDGLFAFSSASFLPSFPLSCHLFMRSSLLVVNISPVVVCLSFVTKFLYPLIFAFVSTTNVINYCSYSLVAPFLMNTRILRGKRKILGSTPGRGVFFAMYLMDFFLISRREVTGNCVYISMRC